MSEYKHTNPIDFLIEFAWANGADKFTVNNAKDQLKTMSHELTYFKNNESSFTTCGWSRINSRGDIYDLRVCHNEYIDKNTVLPIYCNKEEYKTYVEELKKRLTD